MQKTHHQWDKQWLQKSEDHVPDMVRNIYSSFISSTMRYKNYVTHQFIQYIRRNMSETENNILHLWQVLK